MEPEQSPRFMLFMRRRGPDNSSSSGEEGHPRPRSFLSRRGSRITVFRFGDNGIEDSDTSTNDSDEGESFGGSSSDDGSTCRRKETANVTRLIFNRQIYGRFAKKAKGKTEGISFPDVSFKSNHTLSTIISEDYNTSNHTFMGFTLCGRYILSHTAVTRWNNSPFISNREYNLYVWRFVPGLKLNFISKCRIFKDTKHILQKIMFMQAPKDQYRIVCYGSTDIDVNMMYISVVTLPSEGNCKHCNTISMSDDQSVNQGWCHRHGYSIDYMLPMSHMIEFDPQTVLAYPDYLILHIGHHIHLLTVQTVDSKTIRNISDHKDVDKEIESYSTPNGSCNDLEYDPDDDSEFSTRAGHSSHIPYAPLKIEPHCFPYYSKLRNGLLLTNEKVKYPSWAMEIVKKYSRGDFQAGELLCGQIRDDNGTPVEVPLIIQMSHQLADEQLDPMLDSRADRLDEVQLITTQKTFDCNHFIYQVSKKLCADANVKFCFCPKYYIELVHVYPENNHILLRASVMIVTENSPRHRWDQDSSHRVNTEFLFLWDIQKCEFVLEGTAKLYALSDIEFNSNTCRFGQDPVWVLNYELGKSINFFRDRHKYFKVMVPDPVMPYEYE